jgi:hypothetical protein
MEKRFPHPSNQYHFISRWRVEGTCGEVADVLGDPVALSRWWPSVYLDVWEVRPPDAHGLGRRVKLHEGWLPYTLRWGRDRRIAVSQRLRAHRDRRLRRTGRWTFEQDGPFVDITYDWRLKAEKPLLRNLSGVMKPLFEANHRWAMARGEESLKLELTRRRATSESAREQVPPPPGPVTYAAVGMLAGAAAVGVTLGYLMLRARRRSG